jgi:hypothetical protein
MFDDKSGWKVAGGRQANRRMFLETKSIYLCGLPNTTYHVPGGLASS